MSKRYRATKRQSRRIFRRGAKVRGANRVVSMRGGYRL